MSQLNKEACELFRKDLKEIAAAINALRSAPVEGLNEGEARANITLAYRHLEDASMRLGKAIQALDGGTSVYDKAQVVGAD